MTPEFREGLAELRALGGELTCAIMCAEAVWWRCHRRIIADYLLAEGQEVRHILGRRPHRPSDHDARRPAGAGRDDPLSAAGMSSTAA